MELYLERNKDVTFLVLREYTCCRAKSHPKDRHRLGSDTDTLPMTMLTAEYIDIVSHTLRSRLASLSKVALQGIPHPKFGHDRDDEDDIVNDSDDDSMSSYSYYSDRKNLHVSYPYLWFYHRRQDISDATDCLEEVHQEHLNVFCGYIDNRMSEEWADVDKLVSNGQIAAEYIQYIYVSLLTKLIILVSYRDRSLERLSSRHPKAAQKSNCRLPWLQTGYDSTLKILIDFHPLS